MRTFATIAVTVGLAMALAWLPMAGIWWYLIRAVCYLPIVMIGSKHGPMPGLLTGLLASLSWATVAVSRGVEDMAWYTAFSPDFAAMGWIGGWLTGRSARLRHYAANPAISWPLIGRIPEPQINLDLNPLASIQSAAGLLGEDDTPPDMRQELVGLISTECAHLSDNIAGLLQQGRRAAPPEVFESDFSAIIDSAVRGAEFVLCGQGVAVRKEIAPNLPSIECNPDQLRNLVMSLTINVVQSLPTGERVVLNAHPSDSGVALDVRVQEEGPLLSRLAFRFFGSRPSMTGLGLAATYDIVRQHGGRIEAKVNVKKGLEFSVWLPLRRNTANGGWQSTSGGGR